MSPFSFFSCTYVVFLVVFCTVTQVETSSKNDTSNRVLPAYVIASRADLLNSTTCREELQAFRNAVDHRTLWSLKVLDSSGGFKPGFIFGNNFWLGSRSQCDDTMSMDPLPVAEREILNNTQYRDPREEFPPFEVNYFIARFRHNSTLQYHFALLHKIDDLITLGLCLPASCSTNDLSLILEEIFRDRLFLIGDVYSADFRLVEVKDLKNEYQWLFSGVTLFIGFVIVLLWILMILGTMYDVLVYQKYLKTKNVYAQGENTTLLRNTSNHDENNSKNGSGNTKLTFSSLHKDSKIKQMLMCFSVYTNTKIMFNTKVSANSISSINGLKFLTMVWIIIGHTFYFRMDYMDNLPLIIKISNNFVGQVMSNATLSVDTYFFMSGFLLTYIYLTKVTSILEYKSISLTVKLKYFFIGVMHRFVRLTPAYMMTIAITYITSSWYSRTSQFYIHERSHEQCAKYWWRNLLYINNLFSLDTMCLSWSWYLANDMQFFIITLILLILSSVYFYTVVVTLCALLIATIVISGYISYVNEFIPTLDEQYRFWSVLYTAPWVRIGPYIIGIFAAYIIIKLNKKLILSKRTLVLCWCLGSSCNLIILFGLYDRHVSILTAAVYVALSRTVWAIGMAWIVLACCTNNAGVINTLLSFRYWTPFSRLTYCAYLLHPSLLHSISLYRESPIHVEVVSLAVTAVGTIVISYCCAYVLFLMLEMPCSLLMQNLLQYRDMKEKHMRDDNFRCEQRDRNDDTAIE